MISKQDPQNVYGTDYYLFGMPMPNRDKQGNYKYVFQGQEKDSETGKEAFELRLWDARIGRWLTTDPYGQYFSPYLGMGDNPVNAIDSDGGYVYLIGGGDPDLESRVIEILKTTIGKEIVDYFATSPHFHLHVAFGIGATEDSRGNINKYLGTTIGIQSKNDRFLTEDDIAISYGKKIASQYFPYLDGARLDKGLNFFTQLTINSQKPENGSGILFHEILYGFLEIQGIPDELEHLLIGSSLNGRIKQGQFSQASFVRDFVQERDFNFNFALDQLSRLYQFRNIDNNNNNSKLDCGCGK